MYVNIFFILNFLTDRAGLQILLDKKIRDDLKIGRKNFLEYALEYQGISSQKIIQLIKNMIKKD